MKRNKKQIVKELNQIQPYITGNDIVVGFVMLIGIIVIILTTMFWVESNPKWIQKDTNVREETIQHYNPNIP